MPIPKRAKKRNEDPEEAEVAPSEDPGADAKEAAAAGDAPTEGEADQAEGASGEGDDPEADQTEGASEAGDDPEAAPKASRSKAPTKAKAAAKADEPEGGDAKADDEAEARARAKEASRPKRRRGAAETTTRKEPARPVPRRESDGAIQVRAKARYVRSAPRKARLVMDHIRGKRVDDARAILRHTPRAAATDISKLLESAIANAENNFELDPDDLKIDRAFVDEGPTIKRFRPRALGRATPIHKRTSHMTITLTTEEKK